MTATALIENTKEFVKKTLRDAEGGHDWFHIERVYHNAMHIAQYETVDTTIVALGALLHDIADSKFHQGDESVGPQIATQFLLDQNVDSRVIEHVVKIIKHISFKGGNTQQPFTSIELDVVQDADRLDALGAIGIARTFNSGGFKNRKIYDPAIPPKMDMTPEEYKASTAPTLNHFYEKLLLLKDRMNTQTGKKLAEKRHRFMETFLSQFLAEWQGEL